MPVPAYEWAPLLADDQSWLDVVQLVLTGIGLLAGGFFAYYKWIFEDSRIRRNEIPTVTGEIHHEIYALGSDKHLVALRMFWNNTGSIPLYASTTNTKISFHRIPERSRQGEVDNRNVPALLELKPIEKWDFCIFEAKTNSQIFSSVVLDDPGLYYVEVEIAFNRSKQVPAGRDEMRYTRNAIVDLRPKALAAKRPPQKAAK